MDPSSQLKTPNQSRKKKKYLVLSPPNGKTPQFNYLQLMNGGDPNDDEDDIDRVNDGMNYQQVSYGSYQEEVDGSDIDRDLNDLDVIIEANEYLGSYQLEDDYDEEEDYQQARQQPEQRYQSTVPDRSSQVDDNDMVSQIQSKLRMLQMMH